MHVFNLTAAPPAAPVDEEAAPELAPEVTSPATVTEDGVPVACGPPVVAVAVREPPVEVPPTATPTAAQ